MASPRTPARSGQELHQLIDILNDQFALEIPNPHIHSPRDHRDDKSLRWRSYNGLRRLYFARNVDIHQLINNFEEWILSRPTSQMNAINNPSHILDTLPALSGGDRLLDNNHLLLSPLERDERLRYLTELVDDEMYLLTNGSFPLYTGANDHSTNNSLDTVSKSSKRRISEEEEEEFVTAPNSPVKKPDTAHPPSADADEFPDSTIKNANWNLYRSPINTFKSPRVPGKSKETPAFLKKLKAPDNVRRYESVPSATVKPNFSFTSVSRSFGYDSNNSRLDTSFTSIVTDATDVTEPILDSESMYEDSLVGHMLSQEMEMTLNEPGMMDGYPPEEICYSVEGQIMDELLQRGPFSLKQSFPRSVPLRYRYELERVGRAWDVPFDQLLGNNLSFETYDDFWKGIEGHDQRRGRSVPEKSTLKAWEAATGTFKTDQHSEAVVLTGSLDWCSKSEPGILKMKLNPLKTERTCRFHRRFGSDRFLSLTMPAPTLPPRHLRLPSDPTLLRESLALWLTQNVHRCMGRTWRPFYIEQVKSKGKVKSEPKFRVEFFAIDGIDFDNSQRLMPHVAPREQESDNRTPMSLEALIDWHMPSSPNLDQSNCKLFQRFSLGLSKTYATVILKPGQVLHLRDVPNRRVMNDGCALISRSLANEICDSLGIIGNTPSCFQGRIAGAKGIWMVDKHQSQISVGGDERWIQISDSQLKIKPHPHDWEGPVDDEQLAFEVVKWSKPLHSVELNIQLLGILENGGNVREYIAKLTRDGIQSVYRDFAEVLESNSAMLCRSLIQKIKPIADESSRLMSQKDKRLDQWTADYAETIIRFTEAGFSPRSFYPLRKRLGKCLKKLLDRYVDELHIEVPLSTYAFCIADPYGILKEDEVHFGFSNNWRDAQGQFEDNLLDGIDVLVGRLPAHLPSDIQRRRAVWKPELRHFKDVIVFPTTGEIPLAHMLSGGDYDGDTPWICWDQNIVRCFKNSDLPTEDYPPEHFGLTKHSVPMSQIQSVDEFLQSSFTFNLTLSNLGRCTVEHEYISYDESIDSGKAKELACLLSLLVDGRKGGVDLSEQAWKQYRQKISPIAREIPAYKDTGRKHKQTNIIDYLKFEVAHKERDAVLTQLEKSFPENENLHDRDEDLCRPWSEAQRKAEIDKQEGGQLNDVLKYAAREIAELYSQWTRSISGKNSFSNSFSSIAREVAGQARTIPPPSSGDHPMIHLWQQRKDEWLQLLASYAYRENSHSGFAIYAFGDSLCKIKASNLPSRTVTNDIMACYKVNQKAISQLTAKDVAKPEDSDDDDEYGGRDAVEAMLDGMYIPGEY